MKTISIIGAGVGGLTSAIFLQNHGYHIRSLFMKKTVDLVGKWTL